MYVDMHAVEFNLLTPIFTADYTGEHSCSCRLPMQRLMNFISHFSEAACRLSSACESNDSGLSRLSLNQESSAALALLSLPGWFSICAQFPNLAARHNSRSVASDLDALERSDILRNTVMERTWGGLPYQLTRRLPAPEHQRCRPCDKNVAFRRLANRCR